MDIKEQNKTLMILRSKYDYGTSIGGLVLTVWGIYAFFYSFRSPTGNAYIAIGALIIGVFFIAYSFRKVHIIIDKSKDLVTIHKDSLFRRHRSCALSDITKISVKVFVYRGASFTVTFILSNNKKLKFTYYVSIFNKGYLSQDSLEKMALFIGVPIYRNQGLLKKRKNSTSS